MPIKPFGEYRPDVSDYEGKHTQTVSNVVPRGDGYGPFPSFTSYSATLGSAARGMFNARKADGSVAVFAGTSAAKLWLLDNTTQAWTDVSVTSTAGSSTYSALSANHNWTFAQFNKYVVAVQQNTAPQVYSLTTSTAFIDLTGSPPQAAYVSVVNRFLVLSGILSPSQYKIYWSGLNDITNWTSGVNQSDSQEFADGGIVRGVAGGEFGTIFQDGSIRRMVYAPGSPYVFGIDRVAQDEGLFAPYSIIPAGDRVFYLSNEGFKMLAPGGYPQNIGAERVDRTFFADVDSASLGLVIGSHDPVTTRVYWAYKSLNGATGAFDKILVYDWLINNWSLLSITGEYLSSSQVPGVTLEGVDTAYGSNIDTLTLVSLDDISNASLTKVAAFDTAHKLGFFSGSNLEATLITPEQGGDGRHIYINSIRPVTDAADVSVSIIAKENAAAAATTSTEVTPYGTTGLCPMRVETRYARAKMRITAATTWTYALGVEPDGSPQGLR